MYDSVAGAQVATHPEKGHSYRPVPLNRWACDEEGGKAYPVSLLCHPSNTTGFPTDCDDNLVYYLDAWASPPNGDTWYDLSGINTAHPAVWTQVMSSSPAVSAKEWLCLLSGVRVCACASVCVCVHDCTTAHVDNARAILRARPFCCFCCNAPAHSAARTATHSVPLTCMFHLTWCPFCSLHQPATEHCRPTTMTATKTRAQCQ